MIETGWIFPDGTEYSCGGDSFTIHELVVEEFIRGLRFQDLDIKKQIEKEINDLFWKHGSRDLYENYAICRLGWIKVGTSVWHDIKYAGYDWQFNLIFPYAEQGYSPHNMYYSSSLYLPINCNILLAIKNGDKRYDDSGKQYRYDGTDENDYYFNENGNRCIANWSK